MLLLASALSCQKAPFLTIGREEPSNSRYAPVRPFSDIATLRPLSGGSTGLLPNSVIQAQQHAHNSNNQLQKSAGTRCGGRAELDSRAEAIAVSLKNGNMISARTLKRARAWPAVTASSTRSRERRDTGFGGVRLRKTFAVSTSDVEPCRVQLPVCALSRSWVNKHRADPVSSSADCAAGRDAFQQLSFTYDESSSDHDVAKAF